MLAPRDPDLVDHVRDHAKRIRRLETRKLPTGGGGIHTVTHTLIIAGEVPAGLYVPPMVVQVDPNGDTPESKELVAFGQFCHVGTVTILPLINEAAFSVPAALVNGDRIRPQITASSGGVDLSFYVTIRIRPHSG
jgi:hypothetical protein